MNDYGWDKTLNIRTIGDNRLHEDYHHFAYEPTAYSVLRRLADRGYVKSEDTLVDYGCGKGRVSIFMSHLTGCRSIGVEFDSELYDLAMENLKSARVNREKIEFICADAEHFDLPPEADRFYFFNPFSVTILRPVLERIFASYLEDPRQMYLFFYYPSADYISCIMQEDRLMFVDDVETADLFPGEDMRERIIVFEAAL